MRVDGRRNDELRQVEIIPHYTVYAEGSAMISIGNTKVLCNVTIEDNQPAWMRTQGKSGGWITGEYSMLPRATHQRTPRENIHLGGRTHEIRRLIGRSLRSAVNLELLGPRTCILDCDVLQADGGTRTAAITGGYIALVIALRKLITEGTIPSQTLESPVAAVSAGIVNGMPMLDLNYLEDSQAEVDANIVMNAEGHYIEVQVTAENQPYPRSGLEDLLNLAYRGIGQLLTLQNEILDRFS